MQNLESLRSLIKKNFFLKLFSISWMTSVSSGVRGFSSNLSICAAKVSTVGFLPKSVDNFQVISVGRVRLLDMFFMQL